MIYPEQLIAQGGETETDYLFEKYQTPIADAMQKLILVIDEAAYIFKRNCENNISMRLGQKAALECWGNDALVAVQNTLMGGANKYAEQAKIALFDKYQATNEFTTEDIENWLKACLLVGRNIPISSTSEQLPVLIDKTLVQASRIRAYSGLAMLYAHNEYSVVELVGSAEPRPLYPTIDIDYKLRLCTTLHTVEGEDFNWPVDGESLGIQTGHENTIKNTLQTWLGLLQNGLDINPEGILHNLEATINWLTCILQLFDCDSDTHKKAQHFLYKIEDLANKPDAYSL